MLVIPAIDLQAGRSRVVFWPGAAAGIGAPTDRADRIAARFVELGAPTIHVVDVDGARLGRPGNLEAIGSIASRVAVPLQVAGGLDGPDQIRLAFAAGATRVVVGHAMADDPPGLAACLEVAGDWLAIGLDARPERLAAYPWRRPVPASLSVLVGELAGLGVRRVVLGHAGAQPDPALLADLVRSFDVDVLVAGGATDIDGLRRLRDAGVAGVILGEALLSGSIDFPAALEAAA